MLRPVETQDEDFLIRLSADRYGREFGLLPLPPLQRSTLIALQPEAQARHYRACYPSASHWVILADADPVGHLWLCDSIGELRILDIALLVARQRSGIGTQVLLHLQEQALSSRRPLTLSVQHRNISAFRLYRRLGFSQIAENDFHIEMSFPNGSENASFIRAPYLSN